MLPQFVNTIWTLLTTIGLEPKYDIVIILCRIDPFISFHFILFFLQKGIYFILLYDITLLACEQSHDLLIYSRKIRKTQSDFQESL